MWELSLVFLWLALMIVVGRHLWYRGYISPCARCLGLKSVVSPAGVVMVVRAFI